MSSNFYKKLIPLLTQDLDWKALVVEIATKHPKIVYDAIRFSKDPFECEVEKILKDKGFVEAIKVVRSEKGASLKEAKEYVDNLRWK